MIVQLQFFKRRDIAFNLIEQIDGHTMDFFRRRLVRQLVDTNVVASGESECTAASAILNSCSTSCTNAQSSSGGQSRAPLLPIPPAFADPAPLARTAFPGHSQGCCLLFLPIRAIPPKNPHIFCDSLSPRRLQRCDPLLIYPPNRAEAAIFAHFSIGAWAPKWARPRVIALK